MITPNLFHQGKNCRDNSPNAKYSFVLNNVRDRNQFSHLARQVLPHVSKGLLQAYMHATEAPHGYLLLDLSPDTDYRLEFSNLHFSERCTSLDICRYSQ